MGKVPSRCESVDANGGREESLNSYLQHERGINYSGFYGPDADRGCGAIRASAASCFIKLRRRVRRGRGVKNRNQYLPTRNEMGINNVQFISLSFNPPPLNATVENDNFQGSRNTTRL